MIAHITAAVLELEIAEYRHPALRDMLNCHVILWRIHELR